MFILLGAIVVIGVVYAGIYNGLVHARQKLKESWSGIDIQLKRRYDLIPNLVKVVQGYAKHEQNTLNQVTEARTSAMKVPEGNVGEQAKAENMLSGTLKSIFALAENYPDLKANQNFLDLQTQLTETEDQISSSRRIYNSNVTVMNTKVQSFPSKIVAGIHHFTESEFFEVEDEAEREAMQKAPEINL